MWKSITDSLNEASKGEPSSFLGRVVAVRKQKETIFLDLADHSGQVQLVVEKTKNPQLFDQVSSQGAGAYLRVSGDLGEDPQRRPEVRVNKLEVIARNNLSKVQPPWKFDGTDARYADQVLSFPEVYATNPERAAVFKISTSFVHGLHQFFRGEGFTPVEPPIITDKTLYGRGNAITAKVHGEEVFLSQCATFELEPLALALGKVYTISPSFRNEPGGSKRHLAEYTHAKAEALFTNLEELMQLAGRSIHFGMSKVIETRKEELERLKVKLNIDGLLPERQEHITYTDALRLTQSKGSETKWGEGLKRRDEQILTEHCGNKYVWVHFPPFASEGFPYRRLPEDKRLSMTCDLIAPHGAGEMVGVAEKITSAQELVENLIEKGQRENIGRYWGYIALREFGIPPHGGIGAAPERIMYGLLGLDHIRLTKPWPRYPDRKIVAQNNGGLNDFGSPGLRKLIDEHKLR